MYAGVLILDGNRARFSVTDWKTLLVMKMLRLRLTEVLTRSFRTPGKGLMAHHERWLGIWQRIFLRDDFKESAGATAASVRLG
jgi:ATP-dependent RNA helicase DHX29